ncbi:MAG: hypothetical protein JWN10_928 [Solirubrobacterales bacterium]|nr:hypothetical protein [Solirubrobacterales bacterium]
MAVNVTEPTRVEVNAAERVLAEAHGWKNDGYFAELAKCCLEAARDARLAEFVAITDREFGEASGDALDTATGQSRR